MTVKKIIFSISLFISIGFIFTVANEAQEKPKVSLQPDNCETIESKLNLAYVLFSKDRTAKSQLIIIGGNAKKEAAIYGKKRLLQVTEYLEGRGVKSEHILIAVGEKLEDLGYVNFYVNGVEVSSIRTSIKEKLCWETK